MPLIKLFSHVFIVLTQLVFLNLVVWHFLKNIKMDSLFSPMLR